MIRLSRGASPAHIIGEPRPARPSSADERAAGVQRMRNDLVRIKAQLFGNGAKPAWFVERYGCWPVDAAELLTELGAKKTKLGQYKL